MSTCCWKAHSFVALPWFFGIPLEMNTSREKASPRLRFCSSIPFRPSTGPATGIFRGHSDRPLLISHAEDDGLPLPFGGLRARSAGSEGIRWTQTLRSQSLVPQNRDGQGPDPFICGALLNGGSDRMTVVTAVTRRHRQTWNRDRCGGGNHE